MADNIIRRDFLKTTGIGLVSGLASIVLSSCRKREISIESNEDDKVDDSEKKDEITMYVQEEKYKLVNGHKAKTSEWVKCLWDATGNTPYYVGYVGIKDENFCLASDGNAPYMLSLGRRTKLKPDTKYHKFPVDVNEIDFLGKKYQVVYVDTEKITLKLPKK